MTFCCENCFHCSETVDLTNEPFEFKCDPKKSEAKAKAYKKLRNSFFEESDGGNEGSQRPTDNGNATARVKTTSSPLPKPRCKWNTDPKKKVDSKPYIFNDKRKKRIFNEKFRASLQQANRLKAIVVYVQDSESNNEHTENITRVTQALNSPKMKHGSSENKEAYKLDYSMYATKKNISQGLLDIALLTANTTQLKTVLQRGTSDASLGLYFYIVNLSLIGTSITLQIIAGVILLLNSRQNINDVKVKNKAESCNTIILLIAFIITLVNIFIVVFLDS